MSSTHPTRLAIIGAGYAGLAAAVELATAGHSVDVFEASRTLGGRARVTRIKGPAGEIDVDNGQHILIGAYRETLRLMRMVGIDPERVLRRIPLRLEFPGEFRMVAPRLPAPLHTAFALLGARGIDWREKWAAIKLMQGLETNRFRIEPDLSVSAWLDANNVPPRQRLLLWEPLCIAALNTPVNLASAQVLANVLRDSLAGSRADSDMLLPQVDLSELFPEPAARWLEARDGRIHRSQRIDPLTQVDGLWQIAGNAYSHVILAVAPHHLAELVPQLAPQVAHLDWQPIVTSYLSYPAQVTLPQAMLGVADGHAQWLFDRGQLCGQHGLIAAVISARGRHLDLSREALERHIHEEISRVAGRPLPPPLATQTITEKRATFACTPALRRPQAATGLPGLWLAGDYVAAEHAATEYPATLEGAIRSGVHASRRLIRSMTTGS